MGAAMRQYLGGPMPQLTKIFNLNIYYFELYINNINNYVLEKLI